MVSQNVTSFGGVCFICSDDDDEGIKLYRIIHFYELTVKLKPVFFCYLFFFVLRLRLLYFFATIVSRFKVSKYSFQILEKFLPAIFQMYKKSVNF